MTGDLFLALDFSAVFSLGGRFRSGFFSFSRSTGFGLILLREDGRGVCGTLQHGTLEVDTLEDDALEDDTLEETEVPVDTDLLLEPVTKAVLLLDSGDLLLPSVPEQDLRLALRSR